MTRPRSGNAPPQAAVTPPAPVSLPSWLEDELLDAFVDAVLEDLRGFPALEETDPRGGATVTPLSRRERA